MNTPWCDPAGSTMVPVLQIHSTVPSNHCFGSSLYFYFQASVHLLCFHSLVYLPSCKFGACEVELSTANYPWESFSSFYSISAVWSRFVEEREVCLRIQIASPSEEIPAHVLSRFVEERSCMGSCVTLYDCYPFFFTHSLICIGCVFYHH